MAKTTFTVALPDGKSAKRTSQNRTYTHAIVGRRSKARETRGVNSEDMRRHHEQNAKYYFEQVRVGAGGTYIFRDVHPRTGRVNERSWEVSANDVTRAVAALGDAKTPAEYAERQREFGLAAIAEREAQGYYSEWLALAWCGRPDLAVAGVASWSKNHEEVRAVAVNQ